jgi:hypothetical protein
MADGAVVEGELAAVDTYLLLQKAARQTRTGFPYFELRGAAHTPRSSVFRIWAAELPWLVSALRQICARSQWPGNLPEGTYPLAFAPTQAGGLGLLLASYGGPKLVFRRYDVALHGKAGDDDRYTRYYIHSPQNQLSIGWDVDKLRQFVRDCTAALDRLAAELASCVGAISPFDAVARVAITGRYGPGTRRLLWMPGLPLAGATAALLSEDVTSLVMRACETPGSAEEIPARIQHVLDASAVKPSVEWTRRYAPDALSRSYVLMPLDGRRISAVRATEHFATDPLLTSIAPMTTAAVPTKGAFAAVPQCGVAALQRVVAKGNCERVVGTRFGDVPIPSAERRNAIELLLSPPAGLRMYRWRALQYLEFASCAACNVAVDASPETVLHLQRLALLESDVRRMFVHDADEDAVRDHLARAARRRAALLSGSATMEAYQSMPRRAEAE